MPIFVLWLSALLPGDLNMQNTSCRSVLKYVKHVQPSVKNMLTIWNIVALAQKPVENVQKLVDKQLNKEERGRDKFVPVFYVFYFFIKIKNAFLKTGCSYF